MGKKLDRTGETSIDFYGDEMKIVQYKNCRNIDVLFKNGFVAKNVDYKSFKNGQIRNLLRKSVCDVGYLGEGEYKGYNENNKITQQYKSWHSMINRCYSKKVQQRQATYKGCTVCEEWHNFQTFAKWYDENYYEIEGYKMDLDKDILIKGNKVYSPDTCIFVPSFINRIFTKRQNHRSGLPIGVTYDPDKCSGSPYIASCNNMNKSNKFIGSFGTEEEAFYAYKKFKENFIKEIANKHKNEIPIKLYDALCSYRVEIDD